MTLALVAVSESYNYLHIRLADYCMWVVLPIDILQT